MSSLVEMNLQLSLDDMECRLPRWPLPQDGRRTQVKRGRSQPIVYDRLKQFRQEDLFADEQFSNGSPESVGAGIGH